MPEFCNSNWPIEPQFFSRVHRKLVFTCARQRNPVEHVDAKAKYPQFRVLMSWFQLSMRLADWAPKILGQKVLHLNASSHKQKTKERVYNVYQCHGDIYDLS